MGRVPWLLCLRVLTFLCTLSLIHGHCAQFEFPSINNDSTLAIKRNARLLLPFKLDVTNCTFRSIDVFFITIEKQDKRNDIFNVMCRIRMFDEMCIYTVSLCKCGARGQLYLNKTMDASDETLWKWSGRAEGERMVFEREILFVKQRYAPSIKQLTFHSTTNNASLTHPLEPSTSVDIVCKYDRGYPEASPAVLKYFKGMTIYLSASMDDGNEEISTARFRVQNVGCDDMGKISCEMPRAVKNLTTTLLVKCPPVLSAPESPFMIHPGLPTYLSFDLSSYNKTLTGCWITKISQGHFTRQGQNESHEEHGEKTFANNYWIRGSPPNLTLQLLLAEVTRKDVGEWVLTVVNDAGTDDVTFELKIEMQISPVMYALFGIVGFLVVVIITVSVLCVVNIKKKSTQGESLHDRRIGSNFYEEIPDAAQLGPPRGYHRRQGQIPTRGGSPAPPPKPAVDSLSGDYLNPVNDVSRRGVNLPHGTTAAPAGPYECLEMSDMGFQSPYSQL